jgi:hypothetical protein
MGGRRPPLTTTAPVADSQRPQGPLLKHALARIAKGDGLVLPAIYFAASYPSIMLIELSGIRPAIDGAQSQSIITLLVVPASLIGPGR